MTIDPDNPGQEAAVDGPEDRLWTPHETAAFLHLSVRQVYALVRSGELPAKRYGGRWRFERGAVLAAGNHTPGETA